MTTGVNQNTGTDTTPWPKGSAPFLTDVYPAVVGYYSASVVKCTLSNPNA
jgi:hypothetical protein